MKTLILLFLSLNLYANELVDITRQYLKDHNKTYFKQNIIDSGYHNPKKLHYNYLALYKDPSLSKYADVFKNKYNRFIENIIIKSYAAHDLFIDEKIQDYFISHAFYSSALGNTKYSQDLTELFKIYFNYSERNNTKINKEIYTFLYANYLISQDRNEEAYNLLKKQKSYSITSLRFIKAYSNIKHIPLYNNRKKLLQAIGSDKLKLKDAIFEYRDNNIIF